MVKGERMAQACKVSINGEEIEGTFDIDINDALSKIGEAKEVQASSGITLSLHLTGELPDELARLLIERIQLAEHFGAVETRNFLSPEDFMSRFTKEGHPFLYVITREQLKMLQDGMVMLHEEDFGDLVAFVVEGGNHEKAE